MLIISCLYALHKFHRVDKNTIDPYVTASESIVALAHLSLNYVYFDRLLRILMGIPITTIIVVLHETLFYIWIPKM